MVTPVVQELSHDRAAQLMRELQSKLAQEAAGKSSESRQVSQQLQSR
jgi:hypothetical protein